MWLIAFSPRQFGHATHELLARTTSPSPRDLHADERKQITTRTKWKLMRKLQSPWNHFLVRKFSFSFFAPSCCLSTRRWEPTHTRHSINALNAHCCEWFAAFINFLCPVWCFYVPSEWRLGSFSSLLIQFFRLAKTSLRLSSFFLAWCGSHTHREGQLLW